MPMTDCVTSLSMMTDASPMMDESMRERVILAGGSSRAVRLTLGPNHKQS